MPGTAKIMRSHFGVTSRGSVSYELGPLSLFTTFHRSSFFHTRLWIGFINFFTAFKLFQKWSTIFSGAPASIFTSTSCAMNLHQLKTTCSPYTGITSRSERWRYARYSPRSLRNWVRSQLASPCLRLTNFETSRVSLWVQRPFDESSHPLCHSEIGLADCLFGL